VTTLTGDILSPVLFCLRRKIPMKRTVTRGKLITFEGIDGSGKSTHLERSRKFLIKRGFKVKVLREPGSTDIAEQIRKLLLDKKSRMTSTTELLLYEAARAEITARQIIPLLRSGQIVLCDRFYDSTTAYQGYGRKLDIDMVSGLNKLAVGSLKPDLTLLFDVELSVAMKRLGRNLDRLESESRAFFRRVRNGFLCIAATEPRRVKVIESSGDVDEVFAHVQRHLVRQFGLSL
jgi:dTMP kinase